MMTRDNDSSFPSCCLVGHHCESHNEKIALSREMTIIRRSLVHAFAAISSSYNKALVQELKLPVSDGNVLAAQLWTTNRPETTKSSDDAGTIVCLHGWLDNSASFHLLAPILASKLNKQVVALDFLGHGMSSRKGLEAPPLVQSEMVYYVCEAIDAFLSNKGETTDLIPRDPKEKKITLIGHSLGAGVASLASAAFPERVGELVLLDAVTFLARKAEDTALHVRNHVVRRQKHDQTKKEPRVYPNLESAIRVRRQSASRMPGKQTLSYEAARELVKRGTRPACGSEGRVQFQHDARFAWPSLQYMTWEQNEGILKDLGDASDKLKTCVLVADNGWPFESYQVERVKELMKPGLFRSLPGSHYFHADPETADLVANTIVDFLQEETR